jgi:hypothetical protein
MIRLGVCLSLMVLPVIAESPRVTQVASSAIRPWQPSSLLDVDGDGDLDLVSGGSQPAVVWRENLGEREFGPPSALFYGDGGYGSRFADIDGDGLLDFLAERSFGNQRWGISFGRPDGSYAEPVPVSGDLRSPQLVSLGADLPVVIDGVGENRAVLWKPLPSGALEAFGGGASPLTLESDGWMFVPLDIDGDGDVDLISDGMLFRRSGVESFDAPVPFGESGTWADLDGDGLPDLYWTHTGRFEYRINLAGEELSETESIELPGTGLDFPKVEFVGTAEVEGNHLLSWIVRRSQNDPFSIIDVDRATGLIVREQPVATMGGEVAFSVADLDSDGFRDVLVWNRPGENMAPEERIFWGGSEGFAAGPDLSEGHATGELVLCEDFDGDGERDLLIGWISGRYCKLIRGAGGGTFFSEETMVDLLPQTFAEAGITATSVMAADFDLDGKVDLLVTYRRKVDLQERSTTVIWKNLGGGMFADPKPPLSSLVAHSEPKPVVLADWDGDGDLDVFFQSHWRRNNGGALESLERVFLQRAYGSDLFGNPVLLGTGYSFGDIDGDGKLDCLSQVHRVEKHPTWNEIGASFMLVAYGDGHGGIDEIVEVAVTQVVLDLFGGYLKLPVPVIHDLNGNGRGEIVLVEGGQTDLFGNPVMRPKILVSPRQGRSPPSSWIPYGFPSGSAEWLQRLDFDGDGVDDVVTDNTYLSPSQPVPVTRGTYDFTGLISRWNWTLRAMADFDNDGDADLVYGGTNSGTLHLVRNQIVDERSGLGRKMRELGARGPASNPDADADGDGRSNVLEFMEGTNPLLADAGNPAGLAPTIEHTAGSVAFRFRQRADAASLGLAYCLEESADLVTWWPSGVATTTAVSGDWQWKSVQVEEGEPRRFFRLKCEHRVASDPLPVARAGRGGTLEGAGSGGDAVDLTAHLPSSTSAGHEQER